MNLLDVLEVLENINEIELFNNLENILPRKNIIDEFSELTNEYIMKKELI